MNFFSSRGDPWRESGVKKKFPKTLILDHPNTHLKLDFPARFSSLVHGIDAFLLLLKQLLTEIANFYHFRKIKKKYSNTTIYSKIEYLSNNFFKFQFELTCKTLPFKFKTIGSFLTFIKTFKNSDSILNFCQFRKCNIMHNGPK